MQKATLGKTGFEVSRIIYGAIVSMDETQADSDRFVAEAIDLGINYFDVAPSYGDAEGKLGISLAPYRKKTFLACKTTERRKEGALKELGQSFKNLKTDWFDIFQLHAVNTREDVETAFGPDGIMELLRKLKEQGAIRKIGITAHSERAALECLKRYPFDTVMFPLNWLLHLGQGMGESLKMEAEERGFGLIGIKSLILRAWHDEAERHGSMWPKSWCRPIEMQDHDLRLAAMKYALSLGAHSLVPPGNWESFRFMAENIDEAMRDGLADEDLILLKKKAIAFGDQPFFRHDSTPWQ
ncbi:MAG: aldo/keto reductase [Eubacteriales bacterium]|nr:aldo/keto reductase [Eubacteriales bacterium]